MNTLILKGDGYGLEIAPEAVEQKATLIQHAELIVEVNDHAASDAARSQVKKLAEMRILVEKSRNEIKKPVLAVGKRIDEMAAGFVVEITTQEKRITGLIGKYADEVEQVRLAAQREQARIESERLRAEQEAARKRAAEEQAALKAAADAEAARIQAEAAAKAAASAPQDEDEENIEEQIRLAAALDAANAAAAQVAAQAAAAQQAEQNRLHEAAMLAHEAAQASMLANTARTSGVKYEPDYEVTDIHALYRHHADLVELTPKRREILNRIKSLMVGTDLPTIPGLNITKKAVVSTR